MAESKKTRKKRQKNGNCPYFMFLLLVIVHSCWAGGCAKTLALCESKTADANQLETILTNLSSKTAELKSYRAQVEYLFSQPLFESETLRTGFLYYQKTNAKSKLRINFQTLKQDDEQPQKYVEHYIFDGVWLTHIDYQLKEVKMHQLAEPNRPIDAFDLARQNFPIVGFTRVEDLEKEFEIELVEQQQEPQSVIPRPVIRAEAGIRDFIQLHLKVKPDSIYKDDYTSIDFWIDKKTGLPAKITAVSTEEDIYQIKFIEPKVNQKIGKNVFAAKVPKGFAREIIPLKKKTR